ncbi:hypothetical protein KIN20_027583 [Parelaphostrongylus tenuis]|uniref:Uncharacterized protein n=1 Tax=Parelaphostrongylus tenuis TaxID=148309 RepID=A0AAD5WDX4_PARTN|nr:hypothetical protein KIN20_027583 [Parelaphostrongylus tenuis]
MTRGGLPLNRVSAACPPQTSLRPVWYQFTDPGGMEGLIYDVDRALLSKMSECTACTQMTEILAGFRIVRLLENAIQRRLFDHTTTNMESSCMITCMSTTIICVHFTDGQLPSSLIDMTSLNLFSPTPYLQAYFFNEYFLRNGKASLNFKRPIITFEKILQMSLQDNPLLSFFIQVV